MARSAEEYVIDARISLEQHDDLLHQLAQKAVEKAFAVAPRQTGADGQPRVDTRTLTEIGD